MASDNRNADRNEIDSMTREFLARGGKIVQCPPGSSDSVVYKRTSFRRRGAPAAAGKEETPDNTSAASTSDTSAASASDTSAASPTPADPKAE